MKPCGVELLELPPSLPLNPSPFFHFVPARRVEGMKRSHSLNFTGPDTSDYIRKGTLKIAKGKAIAGIRCKIVFPVKNASGGVLNLAAADKLALIDSLRFNFKYGPDDQEREFLKNAKGSIIRMLQRFAIGSEVEGWSDSTTGMARNLAGSNAITNVTIYLVIPTGRLWFLGHRRNFFAMGRSQARATAAEIQRTQAVAMATANLSLPDTSTVTCEIQPWLVSVKGDREAVMPEYREFTIRDYRAELPEGLPLFISERTAAHAATALTRVNVNFDGEEIHRDAPPADILSEYNDVPNYSSEATIFDTVTLLYQATPDRTLEELPSGTPFVEQPNKDLSDFNLGYYWIPVVGAEEKKNQLVQYSELRNKTIKAVAVDTIEGLQLPSRLAAFTPSMLTDSEDAEHHQFAGLGVPKGGKADDVRAFVPDLVLERAKAMADAAPNATAKRAVHHAVAKSIPGMANSGRGFGGLMFNQLRQTIG